VPQIVSTRSILPCDVQGDSIVSSPSCFPPSRLAATLSPFTRRFNSSEFYLIWKVSTFFFCRRGILLSSRSYLQRLRICVSVIAVRISNRSQPKLHFALCEGIDIAKIIFRVLVLKRDVLLLLVFRRYPQIYESSEKLLIDPAQITLTRADFFQAMRGSSLQFFFLLLLSLFQTSPSFQISLLRKPEFLLVMPHHLLRFYGLYYLVHSSRLLQR
jgi:hypothetical protein